MKINQLTTAEENFMKLFWKMESFYLRDAMEHLPEPKPHQNTVSTYLKILVEKGYLSTVREGRVFKYNVIVPLEEYKKFLLKDFIHNFFDDSGKEILKLLLIEKLITQKDIEGCFALKIEIKPTKIEEPKFKIAQEILSPKKGKKSKGKDKSKKKKKRKNQSNPKNFL